MHPSNAGHLIRPIVTISYWHYYTISKDKRRKLQFNKKAEKNKEKTKIQYTHTYNMIFIMHSTFSTHDSELYEPSWNITDGVGFL